MCLVGESCGEEEDNENKVASLDANRLWKKSEEGYKETRVKGAVGDIFVWQIWSPRVSLTGI